MVSLSIHECGISFSIIKILLTFFQQCFVILEYKFYTSFLKLILEYFSKKFNFPVAHCSPLLIIYNISITLCCFMPLDPCRYCFFCLEILPIPKSHCWILVYHLRLSSSSISILWSFWLPLSLSLSFLFFQEKGQKN